MTLLLALVGVVVAFGVGWAFGHAGRPLADVVNPSPTSAVEMPPIGDLLESHPTGLVVGGSDGDITYRNAAARSMTGTHAGVLVDEAIDRHLALARAGTRSDEVLELYGPPRLVLTVESIPLDGGRAAVFVEDISERRRIDQIRTDFVANISHELKTPIGALSVLSEALVDENDPATIQRVVARMMSEAARASETVDDLMELSRIELGGELSGEPVKVADVIRAAVGRASELAAQNDISISTLDPVDADGTRPDQIVITGDRAQLVSAVGNLVENAVKYSEPGGIVQVRARCSDEWVEVMVADQGVGIPQRDLDRIFERFYRVDRARSRVTGGSGLGLSIVRHVATNHDGEVMVSSEEGEGSTFVLRLPRHVPDIDHGGESERRADMADHHDDTTDNASNRTDRGAA